MRNILLIAVIAALGWNFQASANDEHHPDLQKAASSPTVPFDTKAMQKEVPLTSKTSSATAEFSMPPAMMNNMKKMQQQMEKIQATTDPRERQKLMQQHMQTMQENMKAMHGMMGNSMMMDGDQSPGMAMGDHKDMKGGDMMKHHGMMENRMNMMQMMMEQMMQHQNAQESPPQ